MEGSTYSRVYDGICEGGLDGSVGDLFEVDGGVREGRQSGRDEGELFEVGEKLEGGEWFY